jgi:hypothetical protein
LEKFWISCFGINPAQLLLDNTGTTSHITVELFFITPFTIWLQRAVVVRPIEENNKITIRKHKLTGLLQQKIRSKTKQNSFDFCNFYERSNSWKGIQIFTVAKPIDL